jgi:hypothetical protein
MTIADPDWWNHSTFHTTIFISVWKARGIYISIYTRRLHVLRTVIVFILSKTRKVIRWSEFMSNIICAIGQCFTFGFINREVLTQKFHVKIWKVTLLQCHSIGHCCQNYQDGGIFVLGQCFQTDHDLMITQIEIGLKKYFSTGKLIKKNVDTGQRIFVLDGDGIQRSVINSQPQRLIVLLHKQYWTAPRWRTWMDIPFVQQFLQLYLQFS